MSDSISVSNLEANAGEVSLPTSTSSLSTAPPIDRRDGFASRAFRGWPRKIAWALGGLTVIALGTTYGMYAQWHNSGRIASGVHVQGVDLSGVSKAEAHRLLHQKFGQMTLRIRTADGASFHLPLASLGGTPQIQRMVEYSFQYGRSEKAALLTNIERAFTSRDDSHFLLPVRWNKTQMRRAMYAINAKYSTPGRDARLEMRDGVLNAVPEVNGRALNVGGVLSDLQKKYYLGMPVLASGTRVTKPKIVAADLAGRNVEIGRYRTRFDSDLQGRTRNIHVASKTIDGRVLMPGEVFSFNASTGERTWDKGYRMAHIFETKPGADKAEVVDGLAGGVCQVSSTLYNAVRRANKRTDGGLKIVERESHSLPVTYVPSGLDATVAWPNRDFKFRNTYDFPIYLRAIPDGNRLVVSVWGHVPENSSTRFAAVESDVD